MTEGKVETFAVLGTGYHPSKRVEDCKTPEEVAEARLEGGPEDNKGHDIRDHTLGRFLRGQTDYVAVAAWKNDSGRPAFQHATMARIPELEIQFGRRITFLIVDVGDAIGRNRIDVCCENDEEANRVIGNMRPLTLVAWTGIYAK